MALFDRIDAERVYLRPYLQADAPWYAEMALANRDHLQRFEGGNAVFRIASVENARAVIAGFACDAEDGIAHFLGVFRKGDNRFVAQLYLGLSEPALPGYTAGYFVDAAHEGKGYVREALIAALSQLFGSGAAHRITLWCDDGNIRSRRVAEAVGLVLEGHLRETRRHDDGALSGTLVYGALARTWTRPVSGPRP